MSLEEIVLDMYKMKEEDINPDNLKKIKRDFARKNRLSSVPTNMELLGVYNKLIEEGRIDKNNLIESVFKKRGIRSQSGIATVQVLTKPYYCPGRCIFCPSDATMPKSYINTEPGAMRALLNQFDPVKQTYNRLLSLSMTGHNIDKIEMIVLGGTWDVYPKSYKEWFIKSLYDACNTFSEFKKKSQINGENASFSKFSQSHEEIGIEFPETTEESIIQNETAESRIIGLTVETRPEYITDRNCKFWRRLGVTRLEVGLQSMFDDVLEANDRGNTVQENKEGFHKLRQYGFKFSCHFMPGLYKSSVEKDIETFRLAFEDIGVRPDEIKFYPTSVLPNTRLYDLYEKGEYRPITSEEIEKVVRESEFNYIPPYTRIKRLIRDIPETEIISGSNVTNQRQLIENKLYNEFKNSEERREKLYSRLYYNCNYFDKLEDFLNIEKDKDSFDEESTYIIGTQYPDITSVRKFTCLCTRSREIRNKPIGFNEKDKDQAILLIRKYQSSVGQEHFLSFEDKYGYLYGFCRLLLPKNENTISNCEGLGKNIAMVRELHVYGKTESINENIQTAFQHKGFGSSLMYFAEQISSVRGYNKLSVISGVGVRKYYEKLGYYKEGTYMVKDLL